jgi:predicted  nucleic acid-binding Zn-ribbon protein
MTDEEIDNLIKEISEQIEGLPEKPANRQERKHALLLRGRSEALNRIKEAREKHNNRKEVRAAMDYALLTEYGHRNWLWFNLMKSRMGLFGF